MTTIDDAMAKLAEIEAKVDTLTTKINNIIAKAKEILDQTAKIG